MYMTRKRKSKLSWCNHLDLSFDDLERLAEFSLSCVGPRLPTDEELSRRVEVMGKLVDGADNEDGLLQEADDEDEEENSISFANSIDGVNAGPMRSESDHEISSGVPAMPKPILSSLQAMDSDKVTTFFQRLQAHYKGNFPQIKSIFLDALQRFSRKSIDQLALTAIIQCLLHDAPDILGLFFEMAFNTHLSAIDTQSGASAPRLFQINAGASATPTFNTDPRTMQHQFGNPPPAPALPHSSYSTIASGGLFEGPKSDRNSAQTFLYSASEVLGARYAIFLEEMINLRTLFRSKRFELAQKKFDSIKTLFPPTASEMLRNFERLFPLSYALDSRSESSAIYVPERDHPYAKQVSMSAAMNSGAMNAASALAGSLSSNSAKSRQQLAVGPPNAAVLDGHHWSAMQHPLNQHSLHHSQHQVLESSGRGRGRPRLTPGPALDANLNRSVVNQRACQSVQYNALQQLQALSYQPHQTLQPSQIFPSNYSRMHLSPQIQGGGLGFVPSMPSGPSSGLTSGGSALVSASTAPLASSPDATKITINDKIEELWSELLVPGLTNSAQSSEGSNSISVDSVPVDVPTTADVVPSEV